MPNNHLLFVGMAPSKKHGKDIPLNSRSGRRLARLFGYDNLHDFADTVNILNKWTGKSARKKGDCFYLNKTTKKAANRLYKRFSEYERVIVLGRGPASLFGVKRWFQWYDIEGAQVTAIPHPSPVNYWYKEYKNIRRVRALARRILNNGNN